MISPILSFDKVSFGYQSQLPLFQDATFALRSGRVTAILGSNGAGKTTLLSLTLGWLTAWTGEIRFNGIPLKTLSSRERGRRMALVPQSEHTPFDYTLLEYVLMGRAPYLPLFGMPSQVDAEIAFHVLEQVGLADLSNRSVPQLSGGERQLMLLARALIQLFDANSTEKKDLPENSVLLLLDEPTSHLDLRNKVRLIKILRSLKAAGVTLLMTSHEPEIVLALADDLLLVERDSAPQFGTLDEIFTAEALSRIYQHPIRLVEIDGHKQVLWI